MNFIAPSIITMSVDKFSEATDLGVTTIYQLLKPGGPLESMTVGRKRLIIMASYYRMIEEGRGTPAEKPARTPPVPARGRGRPRKAAP
jgi:hypothetical protein